MAYRAKIPAGPRLEKFSASYTPAVVSAASAACEQVSKLCWGTTSAEDNSGDIYADLDKCMILPIHEPACKKATENLGSDISSKEYKFSGPFLEETLANLTALVGGKPLKRT